MTAPITPLEALESLVDQLVGSGFTDASGNPLEKTTAFRSALDVLDERVADEETSFQPSSR